MQERSIIERSIKDCDLIRAGLTEAERGVFNKIKRSLMKTFINPNHGVRMLIDVAAMEYLMYITAKEPRRARSIMDLLSELDLTPKSRRSTEVTKTLSQIFQGITEAKGGPPIDVTEAPILPVTPITEGANELNPDDVPDTSNTPGIQKAPSPSGVLTPPDDLF